MVEQPLKELASAELIFDPPLLIPLDNEFISWTPADMNTDPRDMIVVRILVIIVLSCDKTPDVPLLIPVRRLFISLRPAPEKAPDFVCTDVAMLPIAEFTEEITSAAPEETPRLILIIIDEPADEKYACLLVIADTTDVIMVSKADTIA